MATLLTFQPNDARRRLPAHCEGPGKIILFDGVRYERHETPVPSSSSVLRQARRGEGSKNN